jgi:signal transduction histidine kinase
MLQPGYLQPRFNGNVRVGLLVPGILLDFNNLLTVIIGCGQMILDGNGDPQECRDLAGEIIGAADRASNLTRQLLAFGRRQIMRPKVVEVNDLMSELAKVLHRVLAENIQLEVCPAPARCFINADPGRIEQVLMNLVVNSRDALPKGGRISIGTAVVDVAEGRSGRVSNPSHTFSLRLPMMATAWIQPTMIHIFKPFFTTKERAKGTGLGLSTVYGIVNVPTDCKN